MKGNFNCRLIPGLLILTLLLSMGFAPHGGGTPEVEVSISPNSGSGGPGENVTFVVTVKNAGQENDEYKLTATSKAGWILQIKPASLTLAGGASGNATLRVMIPSDARGNTLAHIDVDVRSEKNPLGDFNIGRCTVYVMGTDEVEIPYLVILFAILVIVGAILVARWLSHKVQRAGPKRILWEVRKF